MFAFAEELKNRISTERGYAIDANLLYGEHLKFFRGKLGIEERQRINDVV